MRKIFCLTALIGFTILTLSSSYALMINGQECVPDEIIVKFKDNTPEAIKEKVVKELGAVDYKNAYKNRFTIVKIPPGMVAGFLRVFKKSPIVEYAVPNYILKAYFTPNDEFFTLQWHLSQIHVEDAWEVSTGDGVTVAVVDTGVNPTGHDSFGNRLLNGYNAFRGTESNWEDGNFHGTHVAGTVAQETNNGIGVAGIAFDAEILPVKVLRRSGRGSLSAVADGVVWATDHGADIINMSLGGSNPAQPLEDAVNYAVAQGVTVVAASGNESGPIGYPAKYESVIAVGAVDYNKELSYFSNFGPEQDLVAPGGDTTVDANGDGYSDGVLQETFMMYLGFKNFAIGWGYRFLQGTSQASPHVAGVAALVKSIHPEWGPDQIKDALINTAEDLGTPGRDDTFGYGLVDALGAVNYTP